MQCGMDEALHPPLNRNPCVLGFRERRVDLMGGILSLVSATAEHHLPSVRRRASS